MSNAFILTVYVFWLSLAFFVERKRNNSAWLTLLMFWLLVLIVINLLNGGVYFTSLEVVIAIALNLTHFWWVNTVFYKKKALQRKKDLEDLNKDA